MSNFMKLLTPKIIVCFACLIACNFGLVPSVSAVDYRSIKLARFLEKYNSPLSDHAQTFVDEADLNGLDYRLVPAISGVESTFGRNYISGTYNGYGWGGGRIYFESWDDGISKISKGLKEKYVDRGATDVEKISWIYCPQGNLTWAAKVRNFMARIEAMDVAVRKESPIKLLALTI